MCNPDLLFTFHCFVLFFNLSRSIYIGSVVQFFTNFTIELFVKKYLDPFTFLKAHFCKAIAFIYPFFPIIG